MTDSYDRKRIQDLDKDEVLVRRRTGVKYAHLPDPENPGRPKCSTAGRHPERRWRVITPDQYPHVVLCLHCDPDVDVHEGQTNFSHSLREMTVEEFDELLKRGDA